MNYLAEINAFYEWIEIHPQNSTTVALWFALMAVCNKAGWPDRFPCARSVLLKKAGCKADAFYTARITLDGAGLISYEERRGRAATIYAMNSIVENLVENPIVSDIQTQNTFVSDEPTQFESAIPTQNPIVSDIPTQTPLLCRLGRPIINDINDDDKSVNLSTTKPVESKTDRLTDLLSYLGIDMDEYGDYWRDCLIAAMRLLTSPNGCKVGGCKITQEQGLSRLAKMDEECIERTIKRISENGDMKIGNPVAYLAACLYNAIVEVDVGTTIDVARDGFGPLHNTLHKKGC